MFSSFSILKEFEQTALDIAAFKGHFQVVKLLLEKGKVKVDPQRKVLFLIKNIILIVI